MPEEIEILLVDDNPADVELILIGFKGFTWLKKVEIARDGAEALSFLLGEDYQHPRQLAFGPKLILLDLKLPKIDGLEVLSRLKANPVTRSIPVVILSSSNEARDVVRGYELGVNSYIRKPVDFSKFKETVRQLALYWLLFNEFPR